VKFAQAKQEIAALRPQAEAGEIALAYLDEVGFAQVHPNRSAWTPLGEQHQIEASRGKRLNVIGAFLATGQVVRVALWCAVNALLFVGFLGLLREKVGKALTIILDNASFHTARAIQPHLEVLRRRGVTLYFLPPYSPELNRIEKRWHLIKPTWMAVKHRDANTLEADVNAVFDNIGKDFRLAF
jgi:transposase